MGKDFMPFLVMVIVQLGYAGMTIVSKVVMDAGMDPFVHTAYRQIFATISIAPFAYFFERKSRPKLTRSILFRIFLCSIFGVTLNQITFFVGLKNSTPTIACALSNLIPGITFLLAIPFGLEKVGLRSKAGQAKILGTIICVGGAMLLSFYHGPVVIGQSSIHWKYAKNTEKSSSSHGNSILGPFLLMANCVAYALWIILQAKVSEKYPAPYSSTTLMCFMASFQCAIIALCVVHDKPAWSLNPLRITAVLYNAIVCTALVFYLCSWCIERKGPLYVSVFNPLLLIIVAILSWALLREKLYVGTIVGSLLIVMGLYSVLWGKKKEKTSSLEKHVEPEKEKQIANCKSDLELQLHDQKFNNKGQSIK